MTREEAIRELSYIADEMPSMECGDWKEAIYMAIKTLEQMPCEDATNGEVLLKMFPPSVYYGDDKKHLAILTKDCELTCYNNEWWNAKYKADKGDKE